MGMDEIAAAYQRVCEVCSADEGRYKCPRCSMFTCSLTCCTRHKQLNDCSGKRDKTAFVDLQEYSARHLRSDYHFLEDVLQSKNRALKIGTERAGKFSQRKRHKSESPAVLPSQDLENHIPSTRKVVKEVSGCGQRA